MTKNISKFQEISILLTFLRNADSDGNVEFADSSIHDDLAKIISNGNSLDAYLYDLNKTKVIHYEEVGEDGFAPIIVAGITSNTSENIFRLIQEIEKEHADLSRRISEILTFNPSQLSKKISETKEKLDKAALSIGDNPLLKPIETPLREIIKNFESVSIVSSNYEDIYKNIIRPVQEEGRSGVKATVRWAIFSIIISSVISVIISNWSAISGG